MHTHRLRLTLLEERFAIARLDPAATIPDWGWTGSVVSITRTASELSLLCAESAVPPEVRAERGWRALALEGPIPFSLTGVIAAIASPLAEAGVPIFAVSTYDTDVVLVRSSDLARATAALEEVGHVIAGPASPPA